jgi:two-component system CheB/CheR fusion protein
MSELDPQFETLLEYVRDTRGFDYTGYRRPSLMRRFEKRMQLVGASSFEEYRDRLAQHPDEFNELLNAILINVTDFFRDTATWETVASDVVPRLLDGREETDPIRVWSAGCASGEEPYTISMLFAEALGEDGFKSRVKIYATDIDEDALSTAREAVYATKQLQQIDPAMRERYFQPANGGFAFRNDLKRCVIFARNDLHKDPPISRLDLLVSRNTLMYFSPEIQERILTNFHFALRSGGFLVVGKAEALQNGRRLFAPHNLKRRIFVKDGSADAGFRLPRIGLPTEIGADRLDAAGLEDAAFEHAPVAQLVVDGDLKVIVVNRAARAMFGLALRDAGRPLQELEISERPIELRSLIAEVRARRKPVLARDVEWHGTRGAKRTLDVQVTPLAHFSTRLAGVSISFTDVTPLRKLEEDLERARRELETAYEELRSTVEDLQSTNEELQSTNEELETTNEELQSMNEELETMNDELRERTDETLRANAFLGSILAGVHQAVLVVDRDLRILTWNRLATEMLGLLNDEVEGEHLLGLDVGLPVAQLRDPLRRALVGETVDSLSLDGHNRRGHTVDYHVRLDPLRGSQDDTVVGVILMLTADRRG